MSATRSKQLQPLQPPRQSFLCRVLCCLARRTNCGTRQSTIAFAHRGRRVHPSQTTLFQAARCSFRFGRDLTIKANVELLDSSQHGVPRSGSGPHAFLPGLVPILPRKDESVGEVVAGRHPLEELNFQLLERRAPHTLV